MNFSGHILYLRSELIPYSHPSIERAIMRLCQILLVCDFLPISEIDYYFLGLLGYILAGAVDTSLISLWLFSPLL